MVLSRSHDPFSPQVPEPQGELEVAETTAQETTTPRPKRRRTARSRRKPAEETAPVDDGDDIARELNEKLAELEDQ